MTARFIKSILLCGLLLWSTPVWAQSTASPENRKWFASTDPQGKNDDYLMLKPGETRRVPLGAGLLQRLWSTGLEPDKLVLQLFNGNRTIELLHDGRARVGQFYEKAFTLYPSSGADDGRWQLSDKAALIATNRSTKEQKFYYQVALWSGDDNFPYVRDQIDSDMVDHGSHTIAPRGEAIWPLTKAGRTAQKTEILPTDKGRALTIQLEPGTFEAWRNMRIRAFWDAGETPHIDVPLLALTSQFFEMRPMSNVLFDFDGTSLHFLKPMVFGSGSRIILSNSGNTPVLASISTSIRPNVTGMAPARFCAAYGSARAQKGKPLEMLNVEGKGAFIGLNLAIAPVPETQRFSFAYLEGNEIITADGKKFEGTGTEDFFDSAWYFPEKPYNHPYAGMTFKGKEPPRISMYRLMLADAVPFQKSLKFEMGHGSSNSSNDLEYHWVAFWYQQPPLKFQITDELKGQWGASSAVQSTPGSGSEPAIPVARRIFFLVFGAALFVLVVLTLKRLVRRPS